MANELACKCKKCGERWDQPQDLPMEMTAWLKTLKHLRCPKCNANWKEITTLWGSEALAANT